MSDEALRARLARHFQADPAPSVVSAAVEGFRMGAQETREIAVEYLRSRAASRSRVASIMHDAGEYTDSARYSAYAAEVTSVANVFYRWTSRNDLPTPQAKGDDDD